MRLAILLTLCLASPAFAIDRGVAYTHRFTILDESGAPVTTGTPVEQISVGEAAPTAATNNATYADGSWRITLTSAETTNAAFTLLISHPDGVPMTLSFSTTAIPTAVQVRQEMDANSTRLANIDSNAATASSQSSAANGIVSSGTHGNAALKTLVDAVPTLAELQTEVNPLNDLQSMYESNGSGGFHWAQSSLTHVPAVVWDAPKAGYADAGSTGEAIGQIENAVGGGTPVDADVIDDSRTWFATDAKARNIITVADNFAGTLALQPDLNPGTTIVSVTAVSITGAATVTATDLTVNRAKTRAHFTVPTLTTTGTYTVVVTVTTIDGQTIPTTATLRVQ